MMNRSDKFVYSTLLCAGVGIGIAASGPAQTRAKHEYQRDRVNWTESF